MKKHSVRQLRTKTFLFVAILLLAASVSFVILFALKPRELTRLSTILPPVQLPSEIDCTSRVHRSSWEPRLDNYRANHAVPTAQQIAALAPWGPDSGQDPRADTLRRQITGNFTGTTDEIFQWVGCKWGIDANLIRAQAVQESSWHQSMRGDWTIERRLCPPGTWDGTGCYQSYGLLQIKYIYSRTTWPMSRDDTAFNVDFVYAYIRTCYEGWISYLYQRTPVPGYPRYHAGDIWGCIGSHYSGGWYDWGAINYINQIKAHLADKVWLQPGF